MAEKHTVYFARDGATALEVALAKIPALVIAEADLPLINAAKLAEILRTNPRTQTVRFFFLGGGEHVESALDLFDELIREPVAAQTVAERATLLFKKRERLEAIEGRINGESELGGDLALIPVLEILQFFHLNRTSGMLTFLRPGSGDGQERGWVSLLSGDVLGAGLDEIEGEKALFRLMTWEQGRFEFAPGETGDVDSQVRAPTRALLLEGARQLDEWRQHRATLPDPDAHVSLSIHQTNLPNMVHPLTQEVLVSLELYSRVRDIVDHCSFPDYQVLRTLQTLQARGMVQIAEHERHSTEPPSPVVQLVGDEELFSPPQERRLRGWLDAKNPKASAAVDAKLVVVGTGPGALHALTDALGGLHGCSMGEGRQHRQPAASTLHEIGRISVGDEVSIVLLNLPPEPGFEPLWQVVAYGGLGVLLLLEGDLAASSAKLVPVLEQLRWLPRLRLFLLRLGDIDSAEARQRVWDALGLGVEDLALFFLPERQGRAHVLRELLSSVLP